MSRDHEPMHARTQALQTRVGENSDIEYEEFEIEDKDLKSNRETARNQPTQFRRLEQARMYKLWL